MKKLILLCIASALSLASFAQFVNEHIQNYEAIMNRQAIVRDNAGDIVFLSRDQSNRSSDFDIMMVDGSGNYIAAQRVQYTGSSTYDPVAMIHTLDDGFLIVGNYTGPAPTGYPQTGSIATAYCMKFNNSLNLLWSRLLYGGSMTPTSGTMVADGVVAVPSGGTESYYILTNKLNVINIGMSGAVLSETDISSLPIRYWNTKNKISYLPGSNQIAITGEYQVVTSPFPLGSYYVAYNLSTHVTTPYVLHQFSSANTWGISNVIQDQTNPSNAFLSYNIDYFPGNTPSCNPAGTGEVMMVMNINAVSPTIINWSNAYYPTCAYHIMTQDIMKSVINNGKQNIAIGFTENDAPAIDNAGLLVLSSTGNIIQYTKYNTLETSDQLVDVNNYGLDSLIIDVNSPDSNMIIKTDGKGNALCGDQTSVDALFLSPVFTTATASAQTGSASGYYKMPSTTAEIFNYTSCSDPMINTAHDRTTGTGQLLHNLICTVSPNPASGLLTLKAAGNELSYVTGIRVINSVGQVVISENIKGTDIQNQPLQINVSNLLTGIYTLQVTANTQVLKTISFTKL